MCRAAPPVTGLLRVTMMRSIHQQHSSNVSKVIITRSPDPADDVWFDIFKVEGLPAIPFGSILHVTLSKVLTRMNTGFTAPIAWAHRFELRSPGRTYIIPGPTGNMPRDFILPNLYDDDNHVQVWVAPVDIAFGSILVWRARARSYDNTPGDYYITVGNGVLSVEIETPEEMTLSQRVSELEMRLKELKNDG